MISPRSNTGIENIQLVPEERIPPVEEISTSIEPSSFTIVPNLGSVNRRFIENFFDRLLDREIRYDEVLSSIERFKELFELIEKVFVGLEYLHRELTLLNRIYTFRKPSEVSDFLSDNVYLVPLLVEAYGKIREYFPSAKLILEVVADPEADKEKELVIFICTNLPPDEALDRLELLDRNWWLDASLDSGEKLCIHVEFE